MTRTLAQSLPTQTSIFSLTVAGCSLAVTVLAHTLARREYRNKYRRRLPCGLVSGRRYLFDAYRCVAIYALWVALLHLTFALAPPLFMDVLTGISLMPMLLSAGAAVLALVYLYERYVEHPPGLG